MTDKDIFDLYVIGAYPGDQPFIDIQTHLNFNIAELTSASNSNNIFACLVINARNLPAMFVQEDRNWRDHERFDYDLLFQLLRCKFVHVIYDPWCFSCSKHDLIMIYAKYWYRTEYLVPDRATKSDNHL